MRESDYDNALNLLRKTTINRLFLAILFSFLTVVGAGSVACGDLLLAPKGGKETITMLRGMSHDEYFKLVQSQTLVSHSMRAGTNVPNSLPRRLWHTFTSTTPPSPNVSTTRIPFVGNHFTGRSGGVVAQFEVPRSALQKSANVFEYEFLVQGGTSVSNVRLLNSSYRAGWRSYAAWGLESTGVTVGVGGAAYGVGSYGYEWLFGEQP